MKIKIIFSFILIITAFVVTFFSFFSPTTFLDNPTSVSISQSLSNDFDFDNHYGDDEDTKRIAKKLMGTQAQTFTLTDINGTKVNLADFKGKDNIVLLFVSTTCPECISTLPEITSYEKENPNLKIIKIFPSDINEDINELYSSHKFDTTENPIIAGGDNVEEDGISDAYSLEFVPTFVFINKEGTISLVEIGGTNSDTFAKNLELAF